MYLFFHSCAGFNGIFDHPAVGVLNSVIKKEVQCQVWDIGVANNTM